MAGNQEWQGTVKVVDPQALAPVAPIQALAQSAAVDAARVLSETQAMVLMARSNPRNEFAVLKKIKAMCSRLRLADKALYSFPRSNKTVTGPSIDLMEAIATAYGNLDHGWRMLEEDGESVRVETYAWDMETNSRTRIEFWMRRVRDTKQGEKELHDERDKYEIVANYASRRKRACLEKIIPVDIVEQAVEWCMKTIEKGDDEMPLVDRIRGMVLQFSELGVSQVMLEKRLGHTVDTTIAKELPELRAIANGLKGGRGREEFFDLALAGQAPATKAPAPTSKPEPAPAEPSKAADPPARGSTQNGAEPVSTRTNGGAEPAPVHVVTKPEKSEPAAEATPRLFATLLGRLHNTYKMTDEQIRAALGGPIEGAPVEELERVITEAELRNKRTRKGKAPPPLNLVPQGEPETGGPPDMEMPPDDNEEF